MTELSVFRDGLVIRNRRAQHCNREVRQHWPHLSLTIEHTPALVPARHFAPARNLAPSRRRGNLRARRGINGILAGLLFQPTPACEEGSGTSSHCRR